MHFARLTLCAATLLSVSAGYAVAKPVTTAADTNLRKGPGTDSEIVMLIPRGSTIDVDKCANGWCTVSWNGQNGFAFAGNVMGPTFGGFRPRPAGPPDVAIDVPGRDRPPVFGRPPVVGGPPIVEEDDDDDGYLPPARVPGIAYRPPPVPYAPPFSAYTPPPYYRW
jgi:hypothetical protein